MDAVVRLLSPDNCKIDQLAFVFGLNAHKGAEEPDISESDLSKQFPELFIRVGFIGQRVTSHFAGFGVNDEEPLRCRLPLGIPEALA